MRLLADECVARSIIKRLQADGFDVVAVIDVSPSEEDDQVLARAYEDRRVLITADKDFGDLVIRQGQATCGDKRGPWRSGCSHAGRDCR